MNKQQKKNNSRAKRLAQKAKKSRQLEVLEDEQDILEETLEDDVMDEFEEEEGEVEIKEKEYHGNWDARSFSELDAAMEAEKKAEKVQETSYMVQDLVRNIIREPNFSLEQKTVAIKSVADDFSSRVRQIMEDPMIKETSEDVDTLMLEATLARDKRDMSLLEGIKDVFSKATLSSSARENLSDSQFALVITKDGKKIRKYPIHNKCLHGDTEISLLDGRSIPIKDLVGQEVWVYSFNIKQKAIVPAMAKNIRRTVVNEPMLEITLDNGESIKCTYNHKFLLRNGKYCEAQLLNVGDSIMPLYRKKVEQRNRKLYEQVYQPWYRKWEWTHHLVNREYNQSPLMDGNIIHHVNENGFDNTPNNLVEMSRQSHCALHGEKNGWNHLETLKEGSRNRWLRSGEHKKQSLLMKEENKRRKIDGRMDEISKKISFANSGKLSFDDILVNNIWEKYIAGASYTSLEKEYHVSRPTIQKHFKRLGLPLKKEVESFNNHKITKIVISGNFDGYDMEVPKYNNFAISDGVFVHNSHVRDALARAAQMMKRGGADAEDAKAALPKIRSAAKEMGIGADMEKDNNAIVIEKDMNGDWRAVMWVTNNFIDWDGEIIAEDAHKEYVDWVNKNKDLMPVFVTWHTPGTARENQLDYIDYVNGFLIGSAKLTEKEAVQLLKAKKITNLGMSHGSFALERDKNDRRIVTKYRMYEVSDLPLENAANPFTNIETISKEVDMDKSKYLSAILGDELAEKYLKRTELKQKELQDAGIEEKNKKEEPEGVIPETTAKVEETKPVEKDTLDTDSIVERVKKEIEIDGLSETITLLLENSQKVPILEGLVKDLMNSKEDDLVKMLTPPASQRFPWTKDKQPSKKEDNILKEDNEEDKKLKASAPGIIPEGEDYWLSREFGVAPLEAEKA